MIAIMIIERGKGLIHSEEKLFFRRRGISQGYFALRRELSCISASYSIFEFLRSGSSNFAQKTLMASQKNPNSQS